MSDPSHGKGPLSEAPYALAVDAETGRAFLAGDWDGAIVDVNLASGDRRPLVDSSVGDGEKFLFEGGFALDARDASHEELVVAGGIRGDIARVDLATGSRSIVSSSARGDGPSLVDPVDVALESGDGARILVLDGVQRGVLGVVLSSGERQLLSGPGVGSGPPLGADGTWVSLARLAVDQSLSEILVTDAAGSLYGIDLDSGERTLISGASRGSGASLVSPYGVLFDRAAQGAERRAIVTSQEELIGVDLATGDRSDLIASFDGIGSGSYVVGPGGLAQDPVDGSLIVSGYPDTLWRVDLASAYSAVVSGTDYVTLEHIGNGPAIASGAALHADFARQLMYASAVATGAILVVDLASGDRVIVSR